MKLRFGALALILASTAAAEELDGLGFLAGGWRSESGAASVEEHWIPADGGTMLGVSRTVVSGQTVAFEFLRIEKRDDGRIVYVAQPNGRPGVDFVLTRLGENEVVFENPQHDHPKLIRYRKSPDGSLTATIEGEPGSGERKAETFHFQPLP